jgi:hypothetical protein
MYKILLIISFLFIQCDLLSYEDSRLYLDVDEIVGTWVRIKRNVISENHSIFIKDTIFYEIGLEDVEPQDRWVDDLMTFDIKYQKGGKDRGYIFESVEEWDEVKNISSLNFKLDLEDNPEDNITFMIPYPDSLVIIIGYEKYYCRRF